MDAVVCARAREASVARVRALRSPTATPVHARARARQANHANRASHGIDQGIYTQTRPRDRIAKLASYF